MAISQSASHLKSGSMTTKMSSLHQNAMALLGYVECASRSATNLQQFCNAIISTWTINLIFPKILWNPSHEAIRNKEGEGSLYCIVFVIKWLVSAYKIPASVME